MPDFLPSRDALLLSWSANFNTQIAISPTSIGLTAGQATAYATLHTAFATAYAVVTEPSTKTRTTVATKDATRAALRASARNLSRIIQSFPALTNSQRVTLGLTVKSGTVSPINPPTTAPVLEIVSTNGRTIKVKLHGTGSDLRGKPAGIAGASIFSFVGATPPADLTAWTFEGSTTRTQFDVVFANTVAAGAQVWMTAFWFNPRTQSGPNCAPISAYVAGGVAMAA